MSSLIDFFIASSVLLPGYFIILLFISCNKDDDTPDNNNNSNNGTATFLENQDGSVWVIEPFSLTGDLDWLSGDTIGFYNENYFLFIPASADCFQFFEGDVSNMFGAPDGTATLSILSNTNNELHLHIDFGGDAADDGFVTYDLEYSMSTSNSNQMQLIATWNKGLIVPNNPDFNEDIASNCKFLSPKNN